MTASSSSVAAEPPPATRGNPEGAPRPSPAPAATVATAVPVPHDEEAVHNVYRLAAAPNIISGGVPIGDAGFDELKKMGVRTIISVDGAKPDVDRAAARGMRYIHIPITYAEVPAEQNAEIARAIRDLESQGPIFIHCHHGKHRSPSATAAAAVALGLITPEQGVAFMKTCGTAPSYSGLYASVEAGRPLSKTELDAAPADFPSVRMPSGMVAAMVEVDHAFEHLGDIRAAGWTTPKDSPDLVPAAEAGRLADHLRFSGEDPRATALGEEYADLLRRAIAIASQLERDLGRGAPKERLESAYKLIQASCKDCHVKFRDRR